MTPGHLLIGTALALAALLVPRPDERPLDLEQVIAWAAPTERDLAHRAVEWHPTVLDGLVAAQAADRPLVLWLYFGGPLGDC